MTVFNNISWTYFKVAKVPLMSRYEIRIDLLFKSKQTYISG